MMKWVTFLYSPLKHLSLKGGFFVFGFCFLFFDREGQSEVGKSYWPVTQQIQVCLLLSCVTLDKTLACSGPGLLFLKRIDPSLSQTFGSQVLRLLDLLSPRHLGTWPLYPFSLNSRPACQLREGEATMRTMWTSNTSAWALEEDLFLAAQHYKEPEMNWNFSRGGIREKPGSTEAPGK
jgi:hypothetical protein